MVSPTSLSIPAGQQGTLNVYVDRYQLIDGEHYSAVRLQQSGGTLDYFTVSASVTSFSLTGADFGCVSTESSYTLEIMQQRLAIPFRWGVQSYPSWTKNYNPTSGTIPVGSGYDTIRIGFNIDPAGQSAGEKLDWLVLTTTVGHYQFPFKVKFGCGVDNTPPVWKTTTGLQEAFQIGQSKVRLYWNKAEDAQSPPVTYQAHYSLFPLDPPVIVPITCKTPSKLAPYECYDEITLTPSTGNFSFMVHAFDAKGNRAVDNHFTFVDVFPFLTLYEINQRLKTPESMVDVVFMSEFLPVNVIHGRWDMIAEAIDKIFFVKDLVKSIVKKALIETTVTLGLFFVNFDPTANAKEWLREETTYQVIENIHPSDKPSSHVLNPVPADQQLEPGWPHFVKATVRRRITASGTFYTIEVLSSHEDYEIFNFAPRSTDQVWFIRNLLDSESLRTGLLGLKGTIIGNIDDYCKDPQFTYLKLENLPSFDYIGFNPSYPYQHLNIYVKINNTSDIPSYGSAIAAYGTLRKYDNYAYMLDTTDISGAMTLLSGMTRPADDRGCGPRFENAMHAVIQSPVDIHLYDAYGNHFGPLYDQNGLITGIEKGIPGVIYSGPNEEPEDMWVPANASQGLYYVLTGTGFGKLTYRAFYSSRWHP
jgi:hypothetical protein